MTNDKDIMIAHQVDPNDKSKKKVYHEPVLMEIGKVYQTTKGGFGTSADSGGLRILEQS